MDYREVVLFNNILTFNGGNSTQTYILDFWKYFTHWHKNWSPHPIVDTLHEWLYSRAISVLPDKSMKVYCGIGIVK
jgi:hypothetical protein